MPDLDAEVAELVNVATVLGLNGAAQYLLSVYFENDSEHFLASVRASVDPQEVWLT